MITHIDGNLFEKIPNDSLSIRLICHVANNICLMKSGFALGLTRKYPVIKEKNKCTTLGMNEIIHIHPHLLVVNMIAQSGIAGKDNPKPIRYKALVECMAAVAERVKELKPYAEKVEIHCPKFASKRAMGNFDFVLELIEELWSDIPVFIYSYKEKE